MNAFSRSNANSLLAHALLSSSPLDLFRPLWTSLDLYYSLTAFSSHRSLLMRLKRADQASGVKVIGIFLIVLMK